MRKITLVLLLISISCISLTPSTTLAEYNPTTGRFLQRDPIGYADGMNLYEYVKSKPISEIDPLGLYVPNSVLKHCFPSPPKTPKKCGNCGPDISMSLLILEGNIERWFNGGPHDAYISEDDKTISGDSTRKINFCKGRMDLSGWDILSLKSYGRGNDKTPRETSSIPGCATKSCQDTVKVGNGCYSADEVNYYLYGIMTRLCEEYSFARKKVLSIYFGQSYDDQRSLVGLYTWVYIFTPGNARSCKIAWFNAGYNKNLFGVTCGNLDYCKDCGKSYNSLVAWWREGESNDEEYGVEISTDPYTPVEED